MPSYLRPNGRFIGDSVEDAIDRMRKRILCSECGEQWRPEMLDECVACGLGADAGICPSCMRDHRCCGMGGQ